MKKLQFSDPKNAKAYSVLKKVLLILCAVYFLAVTILCFMDYSVWTWFIYGVLLLYGVIFFTIALSIANFVRHLLMARDESDRIPHKQFDKCFSVLSAVFAVSALVVLIISFIDFDLPYKYIHFDTQMTRIFFLFIIFSLTFLILNGIFQLITVKLHKKGNSERSFQIAKTAIIAASIIIIITTLIVPISSGRYNDDIKGSNNGSRYYQGFIYEIVFWNKRAELGGEPIPYEEQQTRIYIFPYTIYSYEAKWELKH